jgi:hypothetical protein
LGLSGLRKVGASSFLIELRSISEKSGLVVRILAISGSLRAASTNIAVWAWRWLRDDRYLLPTFASATNLQSFPLNGGGTSCV